MPAPTTTDSFLDLVRRSNLIPQDRLEPLLRRAGLTDETTPRQLAGMLIGAGLLTQFQAQQLLQGKHRGFALGKYKVLERLGSGGSGTVYLCEHTLMRRRVAVKVLPTSRASDPALLARFYREARASGLLDHPNLVRCHDIDREESLHFLVMDYVDGSSLQQIVSRGGPLSVLRACHYIRQAAEGLQHAHEHGLVHRDIKPANILVDRSGVVKVLDLGLARFFNDEHDLLTVKYDDQNVLGTADYVSPEQIADSHNVDIRTDIYSLGATFYFTLTGGPLFPEGKPSEKLLWHQIRQPVPVEQVRPEVPPGLAAVLRKMLAKEPEDRYQTPAEVVAALAPWTREPIEPPPPREMPQLCLAARQAGSVPGRAREQPAIDEPTWRDATPRSRIDLDKEATPLSSGQIPLGEDDATMTPRPASKLVAVARPTAKPSPPARPWPHWKIALLIGASVAVGILLRLASAWWR